MRRPILHILTVLILGSLALGGCKKRPKDVLSEDRMVDLLVDIQLADAYFSVSSAARNKQERELLIESVLEKHDVSPSHLDSTISYYGRNLDDYSKLYEKVEKKLRKINHPEKDIEETEANNIWPYRQFAVLSPNQATDGIVFSFPTADIEPGASIEWQLRLSSSQGVEMTLGVDYIEGKTTLTKKTAAGNKQMNLGLQTDTALNVERIYGLMTAPSGSLPLRVDSIRLIKTDYDSLNYYKIRQQKTMSR